ncbi:MAG: hypothetical protein AAF236_02555 [Verrucomicrobiota bacterium]
MFLEANDVSAHVFDEHLVQIAWYYSDAIGGVRVVVDECQIEEATELSQNYFKSLSQGPHFITVARAWPIALIFSLIIGAPALFFGKRTVELSLGSSAKAKEPSNRS